MKSQGPEETNCIHCWGHDDGCPRLGLFVWVPLKPVQEKAKNRTAKGLRCCPFYYDKTIFTNSAHMPIQLQVAMSVCYLFVYPLLETPLSSGRETSGLKKNNANFRVTRRLFLFYVLRIFLKLQNFWTLGLHKPSYCANRGS